MAKSESYTRGSGPSEDTHIKITADNFEDLGFSEDHIGALIRKPEAKGQGGPMHDESAAGRGGKTGQTQGPSSIDLLVKQYVRAAEILKADFDVNHKNTSVAGKSSGKDALNTKESFTTLHNYEARKREHDQLLREYGFPSEQDPEANRYGRFVEVETDEKGVVMHNKPPWIVAENSELVAEINDEDSPTYHKSPKAKNREGKDTISIKKDIYARAIEILKEPSGFSYRPAPKQEQSGGRFGGLKDKLGSFSDRTSSLGGMLADKGKDVANKMPQVRAGKFIADKGKDVAGKVMDSKVATAAKKAPWGQMLDAVAGMPQGQDGTYTLVDGVPTNIRTGRPFKTGLHGDNFSQKAMLKNSYDRAEEILKVFHEPKKA